jgi:hypothetical protein
MNKESRPARRLPSEHPALRVPKREDVHAGQRAWRREVAGLSDDELIRCVRGLVSVDRAVAACRRNTST